jgi:hypothetical protein
LAFTAEQEFTAIRVISMTRPLRFFRSHPGTGNTTPLPEFLEQALPEAK